MEMTPRTPNDPFYTSAPISPSRISMEVGGLCFFSVPTSHTRTPRTAYEDSSSNVDEFEFDTSHRFDELKSKHKPNPRPEEPKESLPDMAFADELFSDGKVMPLKPPPRIEYHKQGSKSSTRSSTGVLRLPFQSRSLWNDDFDPFMVALENVKEEKGKYHRRARSMSPFRERETIHVTPLTRAGNYSEQLVLQPERVPSGSSKQIINEMGFVLHTKQSDPSSKKAIESNGSENKEMGRQEQVKQKQLKLAEPKPKLKRKFSLKTMGITKYNEEKRASEVTALTKLVQYKPKLLLCIGYGDKYVK